MMIGQEKLIKKLNTYTVDSLPKSILFIGEKGCGKHLLVNTLANNLDLEIIEITNLNSAEEINELIQCPIKKLYLIDLQNVSANKQNQILKLIEEPSKYMQLVLIAENEFSILETILNRCFILKFDDYSTSDLKKIKLVDNEIIYNICHTPGQLLNIDDKSFDSIYSLCSLIIEKINLATYTNALSIYDKLNYNEQYDKIDLHLFFNILEYISYNNILNCYSNRMYCIYNAVKKYENRLIMPGLNKEYIVMSFIEELQQIK